MSYILNQFNQKAIDSHPTGDSPNIKYMSPIIKGTARKKAINSMDPLAYEDECVQLNDSMTFEINKSYYFCGQIKKKANDQIFYVYLIKFENDLTLQTTKKQYVKTVIINGNGDEHLEEWVDVELVFSPLAGDFDCIIFQLKREAIDVGNPRVPVILYQELDLINNAIANGTIPCVGEIVKMGIQAHEGLHTIINNESIHIGKSELYEIKNGIITVYSFSVVSAASEVNPPEMPTEESKCIFGTPKNRGINPFTIDYIYDDGEEV